jgi:AraC-like DNA-binding protein
METFDYNNIVPQMDYFICRNCTPNWTIIPSVIDFIDLTYICDGEATYTINGATYKVEKGDLICIPKNSLRYAETNPENPIKSYACNFFLYDLKGNEVSLPFPIISKIDIRNDIIPLYQELNIEWMRKSPGYPLIVRSILLKILHRYFSILYYKDPLNNVTPCIKKTIRFIYDNYKSNMDVSDLADIAGLNPSYFGTLFKTSTGFTVKEYINRIRIDNAENMLSSGEFSVKEAACKCGFEDTYYFSKMFKKIKGYSPSKVILKFSTK